MSSENLDILDLEIDNYSIRELETFFQFSPQYKYSMSDIETREYKIREQLLSSGKVNRHYKRDLIEFLKTAKERLMQAKCVIKPQSSTLHDIMILDPSDIPQLPRPPPRTDMMISHPNAAYVHTNPSEFFQGDLNPLNTRILTKCLNIDTRFRENPQLTQSSDFMIQLPLKLYKVVSLELSSIDFTTEFYTIMTEYGNNFLYLKVQHLPLHTSSDAIVVERIFTLTDGVYSKRSLIDALNLLICPRNSDGSVKYPEDVFSYVELVLDRNECGGGSSKITIRPTGIYADKIQSLGLDFTKDESKCIDNASPMSKIGWNLGFTKSVYHGSNVYIGEAPMNVCTLPFVYLGIEDYNNSSNYFISVFQKSMMSQDVLARISTKTTVLDKCLLQNSDWTITTEPRRYFGPVDIQRLRIRLYDEFGRVVQMNHSDYSFCLTLKMIYDL